MITIPEGNIDLHIKRTVDFVANSDLGLKYAMIAASPVVGSYDGTTQEIARLTRRSVSTVENWAHGHWCYKSLRANGNKKLARKLWRELTPTHWWKAYEIMQDGYDALYYLLNAFQHGWSSRGMMAEYDKERQAGHAPIQFKRAKVAIFGLASELQKQAAQLSEAQRIAVLGVLEAFQE